MDNQIKLPIVAADGMNPTVPTKATSGSAGFDLHACISKMVTIAPGKRALIETGWKISMPSNMACFVVPRSGLAWKHGVTVLNTPGTIDSDYRGSIKVILINHGDEPFFVLPNMRIAQLIFSTVVDIELIAVETGQLFDETARGEGGFGSTGA